MQAADAGAGGAAGGAESQDREGGHGLHGGAGAATAAAGGAPRVTRAQHAPGPGGDATSTARRPESRLHIFVLSVPFPSPLEAEIAHGSLTPDAEPHRGAVRKELTVIGSVLAVRWKAEDSRLLRISIINFLDQLSLVMRTMQCFGPPVSR
ncbi:EKC/KEOPS complex subunit LAGE3 [Diceros bicornis minor]|uniref:EKC/KEOPS complex subunit LAGE3 n=1 Tax=Diceros bicornis minor TaxID=77932 RepID=UPI0026EEF970|nr:EKC/KEOPS complex subunit LAGE3 [Diceros bicornis minor]